ncbi:uncharacterized protein ASCRUDRAFT_77221 [Ascoidea rubescens DSM 1968]|uniref:Uncharacterized protein n=1 Tax=Ascoidea rubescens DSM 1968 TaxID=1344418 RepID=A0A1D2VCY9_9ASCO|nr:hypothetical protein ASCRUDRAFT_77221 [Ascoidea rubescens DSM 1968]ODV59496.1 hypothetical protein ASCRUDRAFT_77221 [Ascoidea rubescens DSM 1968]
MFPGKYTGIRSIDIRIGEVVELNIENEKVFKRDRHSSNLKNLIESINYFSFDTNSTSNMLQTSQDSKDSNQSAEAQENHQNDNDDDDSNNSINIFAVSRPNPDNCLGFSRLKNRLMIITQRKIQTLKPVNFILKATYFKVQLRGSCFILKRIKQNSGDMVYTLFLEDYCRLTPQQRSLLTKREEVLKKSFDKVFKRFKETNKKLFCMINPKNSNSLAYFLKVISTKNCENRNYYLKSAILNSILVSNPEFLTQ